MGFGASAVILALFGFICKIIGALYRIPLTNILGAEGMGAYQAVFPLFTILLTISSGGITQAVSALISGAEDREKETRGILKAGLSEVLVLSLSISVITFVCAPLFAQVQANPVAEIGYKILAPVIILSGLSALIKGYYQSRSNVAPTVISNLIEQLVKLIVGLSLSLYLAPRGIKYAVGGALVGTLLAELSSLLFLIVRFFKGSDKPLDLPPLYPVKYDFLRVLRAVLPLSLGGLILPLSSLFDSIAVVNVLTYTLKDNSLATAYYGLLSGTASTLTNLPVVFTVAISVTVIPAVCSDKKSSSLIQKADLSVKLACFVCIPFALLMIALCSPITNLLYPALSQSERSVASILLCLSSLSTPALGITQIYSSLLFSVGMGSRSAINLAISTAIKCALTVPAVYLFGIYGAVGASAVSYTVSAVLNAKLWRRVFGKSDGLLKAFAIFAFWSTSISIPLFVLGNRLNTLVLIGLSALCMVLYLCITIKMGAFTDQELYSMPFGKRLARTTKKELE